MGFDLVFRTGGRLTTLLGVAVWVGSFNRSFVSLVVSSLSLALLLLSKGGVAAVPSSLGSSVNDLTRPRPLGKREDEDTALELRLNNK